MIHNKKLIISYFFIFSVLVGLIVPQITNAGLGLADAFATGIAWGVAYTIVPLTYGLEQITSYLLSWIMMDDAIKVAYTPHKAGSGNNNPVVDAGWGICRSLANMLIVLGFVFIGIATILRLQDYQAQKLLAPLIIVAILVNFSPIICGIIIDASNITMNYFMKGSPGDILPALSVQIDNITNAVGSSNKLSMAVSYSAANFISFLVFGLLFFLLIARYIMLWILVIFSPIAFVCFVFPFTKQYFKSWWDQFLKWCIMGIPVAFTLYLASSAYQIPMSSPAGANTAMGTIMTLILPAIIMLAGFFYSLKFSGAGAAIAMGAAATAGGWALGATKGAGKVTGNLLNRATGGAAGRIASSVSSKFGSGLEALDLRKKGQTAANNESARKEAKGRLDTMTSEALAKYIPHGPNSEAERATRTQILGERGDLHMLGNKKESEIQRAISHGVKKSVFTKIDPGMAIKNKKAPTPYELDQLKATIKNTVPRQMATILSQAAGPQTLAAIEPERLKELLGKASGKEKKSIYDSVSGHRVKEALNYAKSLKTQATSSRNQGKIQEADRFEQEYTNLAQNIKAIRDDRSNYSSFYKAPEPPPSPITSKAAFAAGATTAAATHPQVVTKKAWDKTKQTGADMTTKIKESTIAAKDKTKEFGKEMSNKFKEGYNKTKTP